MVPRRELDRVSSQPRWCQAVFGGQCRHADKCPVPHCDPASVDAIRVAAKSARAVAAARKNERVRGASPAAGRQ
eukprot:8673771-Lingulodinium_polyedra.AAC.1